jgi:addiction module HigA family antidote
MNTIKRGMPVVHPGQFLKSELIEVNNLTVSELANMLHVSRQAVSNLINEKADISPEMAVRIATVFGGTPDIWLHLQSKYDLNMAAQKIKLLKLMPYRNNKTA